MTLQIYIYGPSQSGFLDLLPGAGLNLESEAPIFDEDLTTGEFSLPIQIPWTGNNSRILGFAERFKNSTTPPDAFTCTVYDSGFPEIPFGKFAILGKAGEFSWRAGTLSATVTGAKGWFGTLIKNKKLRDLSLETIEWTGQDSREFATSYMKGQQPLYRNFTFVPVAIRDYFDTDRVDYDGEFLANETANNVITTGANADAWTFGRPDESGDPVANGIDGYQDYRTIPFIRTLHLLRKIFEDFGFNPFSEIFDSPDFQELAEFNNYSIEHYGPDHKDYTRKINLKNHVPDMLIVDFLKGLFTFFGIYMVFAGNKEVHLYFRRDIFKSRRIFSLGSNAGAMFSSQRQEKKDGYTLTYNWQNDNYNSDQVIPPADDNTTDDTPEGKTLIATVATYSALASVIPNRQLTLDDVVFVSAENLYYSPADATVTPIVWQVLSEDLNSYKKDGGEKNIDLLISTLCSYIAEDITTGNLTRRGYLAVSMTGSYSNALAIRVNNKFNNKIFFAGRRYNSSGVLLPVSYYHDRDRDNNIVRSFSLRLQGSTGIAATFHAAWQAINVNPEIVTTTVLTNRRIQSHLKEDDLLEILGTIFILQSQQRNIPLTNTTQLKMVVL